MKKFQIFETEKDQHNAGSKAVSDVGTIAESLGYQKCFVHFNNTKDGTLPKIERQMTFYHDWNQVYKDIEDHSLVLIQNPYHHGQLTRNKTLGNLKNKKNCHFISLIHDVEEIRKYRYSDYYKEEFEFMRNLSDVFIVHNDKMKEWFIDKGFDADRLVTLEIFDYLQNKETSQYPVFDKSITIAGNLNTQKSNYIRELSELDGVEVNLYGSNYDDSLNTYSFIHYYGSFPASEIPLKLNKGFGLVWDGSSIDGCKGPAGEYLKYNNPHKLSLYLSSGIPVVIWDQAAEAQFVRDHHVGITVSSLRQLPAVFETMTEELYKDMCKNVQALSNKLKAGYYTKKAIHSAEEIMKDKVL